MERWTPERRRELTKTALIEAATQVFARRGFYGASLDEIAETAGFTRWAIYKNFDDKEGLFLATVERHHELNLTAFSEWFEQQPAGTSVDPDELAMAFRQILGRDPDWFALDLEARLYALRHPHFRERYVANARQITEAVARFTEEVVSATSLRLKMPTEQVARIVEVASEGFLAWAFLDPEGGDLFRSFFQLVLEAVVSGGG